MARRSFSDIVASALAKFDAELNALGRGDGLYFGEGAWGRPDQSARGRAKGRKPTSRRKGIEAEVSSALAKRARV